MILGRASLRRLAGRIAALLVALAAASLARTAEAGNNYPHLFNTVEQMALSWKIPKGPMFEFHTMIGRWKDGAPCETPICTSRSWPSLVAKAKAVAGDPAAELKLVNALINDKILHPYREDMQNWDTGDYYATAFEFLKKSGDCEDYAITKYMLLKAAGMPIDNMRVVAVALRNLNGLGHAILVVYQGDKIWVLDNLADNPVEAKYLLEYNALYSMNENSWWRHTPMR